jgi:hypothetical protein
MHRGSTLLEVGSWCVLKKKKKKLAVGVARSWLLALLEE